MKVRPDTPEQRIARRLYQEAADLIRNEGRTDDSVSIKIIRAAAHLLWTGALDHEPAAPTVMQAHVLPDNLKA